MYEDQTLVCEDCGKEFIFSAGEQEFYAQKGLVNTPKGCQDCSQCQLGFWRTQWGLDFQRDLI